VVISGSVPCPEAVLTRPVLSLVAWGCNDGRKEKASRMAGIVILYAPVAEAEQSVAEWQKCYFGDKKKSNPKSPIALMRWMR
jgi:hypothetical protein